MAERKTFAEKPRTADIVFWVLVIVGIFWGVFGGYFMPKDPPLVFGWFPLPLLSFVLNGIFAALVCWIYFFKYWEGRGK